jgi:hypothetical protein
MKNSDTDYCYKIHAYSKMNKYNCVFCKISGIHKKMFATCKQNSPKYITESTKELQTSRQKKARGTIKETSTRVRPERVNTWPNSLLAR